ncbi:MAG: helix-turn-helix domain-containing protein [Clostridium sp.]|nr:helix-turn-helix domain-containing protein [Clostridium sp.]MCM1399892.1 helix-turn-helix domain-containing protein [Clostridium sp.]MCM1460695.1 helix-turn-helix domain-containing protein [Bacteroides sp.]
MTMGELIRYHRKRLGLSQEELGKCLNPPVNKAAVNKWETGTVENIRRTHIKQLSNKFMISPSDLMCWDTDNPDETIMDDDTQKLIAVFSLLNEDGKAEIVKYAHYISSRKEYRK